MANDYEIVREFYDDVFSEVPFIFGRNHFVTPPKNSSTWTRYIHSLHYPDKHASDELGDDPVWIAVVRDPVERFVSACNSMTKRVSQDFDLFRGYYRSAKMNNTEGVEEELGTGSTALTSHNLYRQRVFWNTRDINDIVDFEIDSGQLTGCISEFIPQYQWAMAYGPTETKNYNHVSPYDKINDILVKVVGENVLDVLENQDEKTVRFWKNDTITNDDTRWFYHYDLTNRSIDKIKNIYRRDYEYGWCL